MSLLRRSTGRVISFLLGGSLLAAVVGAVLAVWADPAGCCVLACAMMVLAGAVTRALDEGLATFMLLATIFTLLGLGLYALHLYSGLPTHVIAWIAAGLAGLVFAMIMRALIASGSADYPYDE